MADKKQLQRSIKQLQRVKTWQLFILLILVGFIAATFLRINNIGMEQRRNAVLSADKASDTEVTRDRLYDLQRYVSAHMNTDMGSGIYLEHQYQVDRQKIIDAAANVQNENGNVFKKSEEVCKPRYQVWSQAYVQCFYDQLSTFSPASDPLQGLQLPKADSYKHVFVSPLWSPDFAGLSVVVFLVILLMIIIRIVSVIILKLLLRRHYQRV